MNSSNIFRSVLFIFITTGCANAQSFPVWITSSLDRVSPSDPPQSLTSATLYAAKGESESFQVNIHAPSTGLYNVNVNVSDLTGPGGQIIPKSSYTLYAEHYMLVSPSSINWNGTNQPLGSGWYPDALVPFKDPNTGAPLNGIYTAAPFSVNPFNNQSIWVDITVPRSAGAGLYTGTIQVTSNSGNITLPVSLTVWNFALPVTPSQTSSFIFWNFTKVRNDWYKELLRHRVMPLMISDCSQQIGTGLPGNACVADSATELSLKTDYGLSAADLRFWTDAHYGNCVAPAPPQVSQITAAAATHQAGLMLYDYSFDEITNCPNLPSMVPVIQQWSRNLHTAGIQNYLNIGPSPAALALLDDGTGRPAVDMWGVLPVHYDLYNDGINQVKQRGARIWSYSTLVQDSYSPKWQIDFAPMNFRVMPGFINQTLGITGLFYWSVDLWGSDPWNQTYNVGVFHPTNNYPGEGTLVYPGDQAGIPGGIVPSMRLKWIRDGMDDYDYIEILKGLGQGAWALGISKSIAPDWTNWTRSNSSLLSARVQLGSMIDQLMTPVPPVTAAPTNVSITPASGSGASVVFSLVVSSPKGAANIAGVNLLISSQLDGRNACWLYYSTASGQLSLANDAITTWGAAALGSGAVLQNAQCSVSAGSSSVSTSGNTLTLNLSVAFKAGWQGSKTLFVSSVDNSNQSSGYQVMGSWTLAGVSGPAAVSVAPNAGTGNVQAFQFVYTDPLGATDLTGTHILINSAVDGRSACWVYFDRVNNLLSLANDTTFAWSSATISSSQGVLNNSRCSLNPAASSAATFGNTLYLNLALTFSPVFSGTRNVYLEATASGGLSTGYQSRGTWTIP